MLYSLIRVPFLALLGLIAIAACGKPAAGNASGWRLVAGVPGDPAVDSLLEVLGAEVSDGKFRIMGRVLPARQARLLATLEDPERPGSFLTFLCMADKASLARVSAKLRSSSRPRLVLWNGPNPVLRVRLNRRGEVQPESFEDLAPERVRHAERYVRAEMPGGWRVLVHRDVSAAHLENYVQALINAESRLERWALGLPEQPLRDLIVEAWASELALPGQGPQDWALATPGAGPLVVWLEPGRDDQAGLNDAGALHAQRELRRRLGPSSLAWMPKAAGLEAADSYAGMALEAWVAGGRGWPGTLEALLEGGPGSYSPHERDPALALLLRVALEEETGFVSSAWRGEGGLDWARFEEPWRERMAAQSERPDRGLSVRRPRLGVLAEAPLTERGGNLGSARAAARLEQVRVSGLDCVGLVVHLVAPSANEAEGTPGGAWRSVEGDAAVVAWLRRARRMGLVTTLVLEHWGSPSSIPAGDRAMGTAAEWSDFFEVHSQAAVHAACLARMAGVDLLCLGIGQAQSLRTRDAQGAASSAVMQARAAGWAQVLERAGGAFSGALTVARNGARQAQEFGPGEQLDACAISLYGDLSTKQQRMPAAEHMLEQRARLALDRCRELALALEQPLVILPLAVAPTSLASRGGLAGPGDRSPAEQIRVLRAWGRALASFEGGAGGPVATFVWRWPALGGNGERLGYTCDLEGARVLLDARR